MRTSLHIYSTLTYAISYINYNRCADKLLSKAAADLRKLDTPARSRGKTKTKKSSEKTKRPGKKQSKKTSAKSGKTISVSGSKGKASAAYAVSASVSSASTSTSTSTSSSASSSSSSLSSSFTSSVGVSSGANSVPFLVCADGLDLSTAAKKRKYVKGGVIKKTRDGELLVKTQVCSITYTYMPKLHLMILIPIAYSASLCNFIGVVAFYRWRKGGGLWFYAIHCSCLCSVSHSHHIQCVN